MATVTPNPSELFGQATKSIESAIQSGLKLQEESIKCLTQMFNDVGSPQKWQKKAEAVLTEMVATTQKSVDEAVQVMNQNAQKGMELFQKAIEAPQGKSDSETQQKTLELWETAMGVMRANTEVMLRANSRVIEAWSQWAKNLHANGEQVAEAAKNGQ
jgi:hypothetical protein